LLETQNGFRKGKSIDTVVQSHISRIQKAPDKQVHTTGIFIDLTKACDVLNHKLLLENLFYYGTRGSNGFVGLAVACWPLVPKIAGSNLAETVGFLGRKNPQHGGEVKPPVPCRRFAACKRSLNLCGSRNSGKITTGNRSRPQFHFLMLGTWRLKWERLKAGESNGKLPPRTCPACSVQEPYQSHDWALVPAKPGLQG